MQVISVREIRLFGLVDHVDPGDTSVPVRVMDPGPPFTLTSKRRNSSTVYPDPSSYTLMVGSRVTVICLFPLNKVELPKRGVRDVYN